jgi:uncharacterized protein with HEPN domain
VSERSASILLEDMRDAAAKIARYVQGKDAVAFLADEQCEDACVRNLEIIGEAASRLIVPGGGVALLRCVAALDELK